MPSVLRRLRDRGDIERAPSRFLHQGQPYPFELYPANSLPGSPVEASMSNFPHTVQTIGGRSSIVGGAVQARSLALCQVSFTFRSKRDQSRYFGTSALRVLEEPGGGLTLWGLLSRVEPDVAYHGNAYWRRTPDGRLVRLRPDWVSLMIGSDERPGTDEALMAADAELLGYVYQPGGPHSKHRPQFLTLAEVMHWAPEPHPLANFIGESWVSGVYREIAADMQATDHVSKFFDNAATPNMVAKAPEAITNPTQFNEWVDAMEGAHRGTTNAWRTVYVQAGTDIQVVGSELGRLAMQDLHGGFETRVSTRSRVPATVALYREGNQGSALNGGNYGQIRRMWADSWFQSYAQGFCSAVGRIVDVPGDAELTFNPSKVLLLQEDELDAAEIRQKNAATIRTLIDGGYEADAAVEFVRNNGNLRELLGGHSGLPSVQVQPSAVNGAAKTPPSTERSIPNVTVYNHVPGTPAPIVRVEAAPVPDVHVNAPINVTTPAPVVEAPVIDVHIPEPVEPVKRTVVRHLERDDSGHIVRVREEDA